ncbi:putative proline dehydrogenase [Lasiodiplodia theobromae]|uniref:Proline dehydrogenase n=1 Tax=Lasiodiplodia theobromae TaxID=45133 RepID=A0A5N5DAE7_9PEZI|nr:putative proline dehydrogenase [Lasiodiplodia theobromae]
MSSKWLLKPSIAFLGAITGSKSAFLNPDKNLLISRLLKWTIYDQFCSGTNPREVRKSVAALKSIGYQGVILTHAKEIVLDESQRTLTAGARPVQNSQYHDLVERWKHSSMETLRMVGPGDFLALKLTGAGPMAVNALRSQDPIPEAVENALTQICEEARKQGSRVWVDGEQQVLQRGIDEWVIELMRRWNTNGQALVYNTIQGYLKGSNANVDRHISLAAAERWTLGIKLVRGAYIEHEVRSLIHDTKEDTDRSYDAIAEKLISQRLPPEAQARGLSFPSSALFLATHNAASVSKACAMHRARLTAGLPTTSMECGQIAGMADELGCELISNYERCLVDASAEKARAPKAFKCLTWGSVGECMGFLHRRAIENRGAVERTKHMAGALREELWRRVWGIARKE